MTETPSANLPRARSFPWLDCLVLFLLGGAVAAAGIALRFYPSEPPEGGVVRQIRITAKPGIDLSKLEEVFDTPDYYIVVRTEPGTVRTPTFADTRIGNGLTFQLPVPLRMQDILEVKVFDENVRTDTLVDRIDQPGRQTDGGRFHFALMGEVPPPSRQSTMGLVLLVAGGLTAGLAIVRFLRAQVV